MNILVINCGSSSLKFLIESIDPETTGDDREMCLARGIIERIGGVSLLTLRRLGGLKPSSSAEESVKNHQRYEPGFAKEWSGAESYSIHCETKN